MHYNINHVVYKFYYSIYNKIEIISEELNFKCLSSSENNKKSQKDGGNDEEINCLALCPNCATAFDLILKPAIYNALDKLNDKIVPDSWENGESRKGV